MLVLPDLGLCTRPQCTAAAVVYVGGPTLDPSPRLLFIAGPRAAMLTGQSARAGQLGGRLSNVLCLDCAILVLKSITQGSR
jgi:hypothetical protein